MLMPLRLTPGTDLRQALHQRATQPGVDAFLVVCGIGSLSAAQIRMAGDAQATEITGPLEILTLSVSVSPDHAHLHIAVSDRQGRVLGGHVCLGCEVLTTAEMLLAPLPGWQLTREPDSATGYPELTVRRSHGSP